jgi:hypothetical protein
MHWKVDIQPVRHAAVLYNGRRERFGPLPSPNVPPDFRHVAFVSGSARHRVCCDVVRYFVHSGVIVLCLVELRAAFTFSTSFNHFPFDSSISSRRTPHTFHSPPQTQAFRLALRLSLYNRTENSEPSKWSQLSFEELRAMQVNCRRDSDEFEIDLQSLLVSIALIKMFTCSFLSEWMVEQAAFAKERNWEQHHTPRNIALAMVGEVGEICECFQV